MRVRQQRRFLDFRKVSEAIFESAFQNAVRDRSPFFFFILFYFILDDVSPITLDRSSSCLL